MARFNKKLKPRYPLYLSASGSVRRFGGICSEYTLWYIIDTLHLKTRTKDAVSIARATIRQNKLYQQAHLYNPLSLVQKKILTR